MLLIRGKSIFRNVCIYKVTTLLTLLRILFLGRIGSIGYVLPIRQNIGILNRDIRVCVIFMPLSWKKFLMRILGIKNHKMRMKTKYLRHFIRKLFYFSRKLFYFVRKFCYFDLILIVVIVWFTLTLNFLYLKIKTVS